MALLWLHTFAVGYTRWGCPAPRSVSSKLRSPPCGEVSGNFSDADLIEVSPGPLTVRFEEAIASSGSPFRIALTGDGNDASSCTLLDHIPHDDSSNPSFSDERTYQQYVITIDIPDVACERCSLQLSHPITRVNSLACRLPGTGGDLERLVDFCSSIFYSCTVPLKITGRTKRDDYKCPGGLPDDWPKQWVGPKGKPKYVDASTADVYWRESARWDSLEEVNEASGRPRITLPGWDGTSTPRVLKDAPSRYQQMAGDLCAIPEKVSKAAADEVKGALFKEKCAGKVDEKRPTGCGTKPLPSMLNLRSEEIGEVMIHPEIPEIEIDGKDYAFSWLSGQNAPAPSAAAPRLARKSTGGSGGRGGDRGGNGGGGGGGGDVARTPQPRCDLPRSADGRCGPIYGDMACAGDDMPCCSSFGWCGREGSSAHCSSDGRGYYPSHSFGRKCPSSSAGAAPSLPLLGEGGGAAQSPSANSNLGAGLAGAVIALLSLALLYVGFKWLPRLFRQLRGAKLRLKRVGAAGDFREGKRGAGDCEEAIGEQEQAEPAQVKQEEAGQLAQTPVEHTRVERTQADNAAADALSSEPPAPESLAEPSSDSITESLRPVASAANLHPVASAGQVTEVQPAADRIRAVERVPSHTDLRPVASAGAFTEEGLLEEGQDESSLDMSTTSSRRSRRSATLKKLLSRGSLSRLSTSRKSAA